MAPVADRHEVWGEGVCTMMANESEYDLRSSNNSTRTFVSRAARDRRARRCVIEYKETEFVYFSSYCHVPGVGLRGTMT